MRENTLPSMFCTNLLNHTALSVYIANKTFSQMDCRGLINTYLNDCNLNLKSQMLQEPALDLVNKVNPKSRWWIKTDATDIKEGLRESMNNEWSGDIDWGDGTLQKKHEEYKKYLEFVRSIGCRNRKDPATVRIDLTKVMEGLQRDIQFLSDGQNAAKGMYERKRKQVNVSEEVLFALGWDLEGYSQLIQMNSSLSDMITEITCKLDSSGHASVSAGLSVLKKKLEDYAKGISMKKREVASHILLFMISDEQRNQKPYAVPVRFIKYKSITDEKLRNLEDELKERMKAMGMVPVGE